MGDPVQSLSKTVHPEVAGPKLQQNHKRCPNPLEDYLTTTRHVEIWTGLDLWNRVTSSAFARKKTKIAKMWS